MTISNTRFYSLWLTLSHVILSISSPHCEIRQPRKSKTLLAFAILLSRFAFAATRQSLLLSLFLQLPDVSSLHCVFLYSILNR